MLGSKPSSNSRLAVPGQPSKDSKHAAKANGSSKLSKAERQQQKAAAAKQEAELELLMMDDSSLRDAAKGVGLGAVTKSVGVADKAVSQQA